MPLNIYTNPNLGPALRFQGSAMMAQGFAQGINTAGAGLAQALQRRQEEEKRTLQNGKIAEQIIQANPDLLEQLNMSPEAFKSMSSRDKAGAIQAVITSTTIQQALNQAAQARAEADRTRKSPAFLQALSKSGQAPSAIPAPIGNDMFQSMTETDPLRRISGAAQQSGFAPTVPETVDLMRGMESGAQANEFPIGQLGIPFGVPNRPDLDAIPVSRGSIQISPKPLSGELKRKMIDGKPSGWLETPDGKYVRDPTVASAETGPDPAQFDANGDGVLDEREWQQWMLASKLGAGGGAYPGMKVTQPQPAAGAPAGISADDFKRWKAGRGK